jgi:hypothetical protein
MKKFEDFTEEQQREIGKADVIEYDDDGNIIGWGTHADYDYYAVDVQNGNGYYDNDGHFHRHSYNRED